MKIYANTRGLKKAPIAREPQCYVNLQKNAMYINTNAGRFLGVTKNKKVVFGVERRGLYLGVLDKENTAENGFNPSLKPKSTASSVGAPKYITEQFTQGKYTITETREEDSRGIIWHRLALQK